ncbi:MAG TPA: polyprenyl synthetase family protein, partial [Myxococcaceae bacterium]|nr:polyprenyl synthetase family protein [Myxococcaceae bacterium]
MVPSPSVAAPALAASLPERGGLGWGRERVEAAVRELLEQPDEARLDRHWARAREQVREYALREGGRERAALVVAGWCLGSDSAVIPARVWRFAAGVELLHTLWWMHDDVAERAWLRRGGLALHHLLAPGRGGEDLAVVAGDHLFALAMEAMLGSGLPGAAR